ncbi:MAG: DUF4159 domain-containing protein [Flavobacteriales bacterium]
MNKFKFILGLILVLLTVSFVSSTKPSYKFAVLKYSGGGDWYANPTSVPNLVGFCNKNLGMNINQDVDEVNVGDPELFNYPFVHMTGHGNVVFTENDVTNLRKYLNAGGFLHIDDNYGMDKFVRTELKKVFPNTELIELPFSHPIYNQTYKFGTGLPKIHEHDDKAPKGLAIIKNGRVLVYYSVECDLGDGWEDEDVHNDTKEARDNALKMGANIVQFSLMNN